MLTEHNYHALILHHLKGNPLTPKERALLITYAEFALDKYEDRLEKKRKGDSGTLSSPFALSIISLIPEIRDLKGWCTTSQVITLLQDAGLKGVQGGALSIPYTSKVLRALATGPNSMLEMRAKGRTMEWRKGQGPQS